MSLVECSPRGPALPIEPLRAYLRARFAGVPADRAAASCGIHERAWFRIFHEQDRIYEATVDAMCCELDVHIGFVYPEYWENYG